MSGINVVFASTPRGVLGTCFRCRDRMRTCKCFEVALSPLAVARQDRGALLPPPRGRRGSRTPRALPPPVSLTGGSMAWQDAVQSRRINENTDRMSELVASSFDGSRAGSRLGTRSRPGSAMAGSSRPQSAMGGSKGFDHRVQSGRPLSSMSNRSHGSSRHASGADYGHAPVGGACEEVDESDETKPIFRRPQDISSYSTAYTMSATKWGARQDPLHRGPVGASFRPKLGFRPSSANSRRSRQDEEMSPPLSERSFGKLSGQMPLKHSQTQAVLGVPQQRVDFLLRQLRLLCYRKVKGNGSDVSVREIFRHFDSNKDEDEDGAGIDAGEFYDMLQKLMLGTPEDGLVTEEEAHLMFKQIDTNNGGTIDYREVAQLLSQPGWDARLVGRMSNVLL